MRNIARFRVILTSFLLALALSGCSSLGAETQTRDFCRLAKPIYVGKPDYFTDQTARQILGHNELGHSLCGWLRV